MILKSQRTLFFFLMILLLATLACGLSLGSEEAPPAVATPTAPAISTVPPQNTPDAGQATAESAPVINSPNAMPLALEESLISLYEQVNPSVVHIFVFLDPDDVQPLGSGSGFVYDTAGRIVTNNHVVADGNAFEVVFADGSRRRATVIGSDADSDLAVIEVEALPAGVNPLPLGDSNEVQVGQLVVAIGNPFNEQGSMTLGIVSGLGRSLQSQRALENPALRYSLPEGIQTDAPINPGNSGGPLLNLQGEVIGVNSRIQSVTGVNSGVGFAIPVNAVRLVAPSLIENGSYVYPFMGVEITTLNLNQQEQLNLSQVQGAYLTGVRPGTPADEAGLIPADEAGLGGDLIVAIDGEPIIDADGLISYLVFNTEVGQTIDLTVIRNGERITVPLTLGARP